MQRSRRQLCLGLLATSAGCSGLPPPTPAPVDRPAATVDRVALDGALRALVEHPERPVLSVVALARRGERLVYANGFGLAEVAAEGRAARPATPRTLYRVASISKSVVTLGVLRLVDAGVLALDEDVSRWLGWPLRHPGAPERPITLALLLSHRSGLSDGDRYTFDAATALRDVLHPEGALFGRWRNWAGDALPGERFQYVNLNFGVVASVMEAATGERFDRLIDRLVLAPLGMRGGFHPSGLSAADFANLGTIYRKRTVDTEVWDAAGPWIGQVDDVRGQRPTSPDADGRYVPGRNGTLFSPQGGLRTDAESLDRIVRLLLGTGAADGVLDGQRFLSAASMQRLRTPLWRADPAAPAQPGEWAFAWATGLQRFTDTAGPMPNRGDRLFPGFTGSGHSGDAYGLLGMMAADAASQRSVVVLVTGPSADPLRHRGRHSARARWQEEAIAAVFEHALR